MRLLSWARTGVEIQQYPSMKFRATEIEVGCRRSVAELIEDLRCNAALFEKAVVSLPADAWSRLVVPRTGEPRTAATLIPIRLRELEIHHVDLGLDYTFDDIPEADADWILHDLIDAMARGDVDLAPVRLKAIDSDLDRVLDGGASRGTPLLEVSGTRAELLGWLSGRVAATDTMLAARGRLSSVPHAPQWI